MRECYVCKRTGGLHSHHVFGGPNRKHSEKHGMKVDLCGKHHNLSNLGVHFNPKLDLELKQVFQTIFEEQHGHDEFMKVFGRNYL